MDKKEIEQLLNGAIEAYRAHGEAKKRARNWKDEHPEPEPKDVYESIDDLLQFACDRQSYGVESVKVAEEVNHTRNVLKEARDRFDEYLPALVWCRVGDCGVGLSYGPDYQVSIEVEPWSDKMPELDHHTE